MIPLDNQWTVHYTTDAEGNHDNVYVEQKIEGEPIAQIQLPLLLDAIDNFYSRATGDELAFSMSDELGDRLEVIFEKTERSTEITRRIDSLERLPEYREAKKRLSTKMATTTGAAVFADLTGVNIQRSLGKREKMIAALKQGVQMNITHSKIALSMLAEDLVTASEIADNSDMNLADFQRCISYIGKYNLWIDPLKETG